MPFDHEQPVVSELPLEAIRVECRFRRELGDIAVLAASIAGVSPCIRSSSRRTIELIAGQRRLEAMRKLGRTHVPVRVIPIDDMVRGGSMKTPSGPTFCERVYRHQTRSRR